MNDGWIALAADKVAEAELRLPALRDGMAALPARSRRRSRLAAEAARLEQQAEAARRVLDAFGLPDAAGGVAGEAA